jgi:hypothetical protein
MPEEKPKAVVHFNHDPVVLRVDDMIDGEIPGSKVAKLVGEIPLSRGVNQVDADLWALWIARNAQNPLVSGGLLYEEGKLR